MRDDSICNLVSAVYLKPEAYRRTGICLLLCRESDERLSDNNGRLVVFIEILFEEFTEICIRIMQKRCHILQARITGVTPSEYRYS